MLSIVKSMALHGLDGYLVSIQVDVSEAMPYFEIVGLPDTSVKESKERVKTAIKNSNAELLSRRIIVNLAPANIRKEGSVFDLPIAIGILIATHNIHNNNLDEMIKDTIFIGELSLDGTVEKVNGVLPICIEAKRLGIKNIILSKRNAKEAAIIKGINIIPIDNLEQAIKYLNGEIKIEKEENINFINSNIYKEDLDFSDVKRTRKCKKGLRNSC